jgi:hypothetical protein
MKIKLITLGFAIILVPVTAQATLPAPNPILCQEPRTKVVRSFDRCPKGTVEVFAMINSGGGGHWTSDGRWIGQVAPRVDRSAPVKRSRQDDEALEALLHRTPRIR